MPYAPAPRFLCGPYPFDPAPLLASGVTCFVDLTEPGELPGYRHSVHGIQMPIPDFGVPTPFHMTTILDTLDAALAEGHTVYLHCHGGRGRTGTVVGCWLVRHGLSGEQALARIADLRGDNQSPETEEQRAFILNWQNFQQHEFGPASSKRPA